MMSAHRTTSQDTPLPVNAKRCGPAGSTNESSGKVIKEDADYEGVRITFRGSLQNVQLPMQIDVGIGDVVYPGALVTEYPTILGQAAPKPRGTESGTESVENRPKCA